MRESHWIEGTRTRLQPQERQALLAALASDQKAHLLEHDYFGVEGVGVLWKPDGDGRGNPVPRVEAGSLRGMVGAQNAKAT